MANFGNKKPVIKIIKSKTACIIVRPEVEFNVWCDNCGDDFYTSWPEVEFQSKIIAYIYAWFLAKSEQFKDCKIEVVKCPKN